VAQAAQEKAATVTLLRGYVATLEAAREAPHAEGRHRWGARDAQGAHGGGATVVERDAFARRPAGRGRAEAHRHARAFIGDSASAGRDADGGHAGGDG